MSSKVLYPEDYTEEDKAIYDDLISRGQALIGKKLAKCDEFLLDLSAKITINQMKGYRGQITPEEIEAVKALHKNASQILNVETPMGLYEEGKHPLELSTPPALMSEASEAGNNE